MLAFTLLTLAASALAAPQLARRATTTVVKVGADSQLKFEPDFVNGVVGDIIEFHFVSKNHSVVQSSFASPCGPLAGGFKTDFQFSAPGLAEDAVPKISYTIQDASQPLWFYCSQANHTPNSHCVKGMVFAINCPPTGEKSLPNFIQHAMSSGADQPLADPTLTLPPDPVYPPAASITLPPLETPVISTAVVSVETSTWTTTYASYPGSPAPTPGSLEGNVITVNVGGNGELKFDPPHVTALPRDKIVFNFQGKNHSVVQSAFGSPCTPLVTADSIGINSGFFPFVAGSPAPQFTFTVADTTPKYFFCGQTGHCGKGMVFSVNTNEAGPRNYAAFQTLAMQINGTDATTAPGGAAAPPADGGSGAARTGASVGVVLVGALAALLL